MQNVPKVVNKPTLWQKLLVWQVLLVHDNSLTSAWFVMLGFCWSCLSDHYDAVHHHPMLPHGPLELSWLNPTGLGGCWKDYWALLLHHLTRSCLQSARPGQMMKKQARSVCCLTQPGSDLVLQHCSSMLVELHLAALLAQ